MLRNGAFEHAQFQLSNQIACISTIKYITWSWACCKTWTGPDWTGLEKHGLSPGFVKHGLSQSRFCKTWTESMICKTWTQSMVYKSWTQSMFCKTWTQSMCKK